MGHAVLAYGRLYVRARWRNPVLPGRGESGFAGGNSQDSVRRTRMRKSRMLGSVGAAHGRCLWRFRFTRRQRRSYSSTSRTRPELQAWANVDINVIVSNTWQAAADARTEGRQAAPAQAALQAVEPASRNGTFRRRRDQRRRTRSKSLSTGEIGLSWDEGHSRWSWTPYKSLKMDMTAPRDCLVAFASGRRWGRVRQDAFVKTGRSTIEAGIVDAYPAPAASQPGPSNLVPSRSYVYSPHEASRSS